MHPNAQHNRLVIEGGGAVQVYEEGTHIMIPWFERAIIYDVRARPNVIQSTSGSRDLQMVRRRARTSRASSLIRLWAPPRGFCRTSAQCIPMQPRLNFLFGGNDAAPSLSRMTGQYWAASTDAAGAGQAAGNLPDTGNRLWRARAPLHHPGARLGLLPVDPRLVAVGFHPTVCRSQFLRITITETTIDQSRCPAGVAEKRHCSVQCQPAADNA